jgi:aromatic ring hydroxylase
MRIERAMEHAAGRRAVVKVVLEGQQGITDREVPASEFEATERGLTMGSVLVPWVRVFRYDTIMRQVFAPDVVEGGSRVKQRLVYQDERGLSQVIEVALDSFEASAWAVTVLAEREVDAERGELVTRKISIPWHRVIETERIFAVPEPEPVKSGS